MEYQGCWTHYTFTIYLQDKLQYYNDKNNDNIKQDKLNIFNLVHLKIFYH